MARVAFDLGRSALVTLDQHRIGTSRPGDTGRVVERHAGSDVLWRTRIRQNPHVRPAAAAYSRQAHQGERRAHEFQETPAIDRRSLGLASILEDVLESRKFTIVLVHRWHPWQDCGGLTLNCFFSFWPNSSRPSVGSCHDMFVASPDGRRFGSGWRWQLRHQLMLKGFSCVTTGISLTWP